MDATFASAKKGASPSAPPAAARARRSSLLPLLTVFLSPYPDANDAARLAADPIHKMLLNRDPGAGRDLASQPTLSRFENAIGAKDLYRLSEALAGSVIRALARSAISTNFLSTMSIDLEFCVNGQSGDCSWTSKQAPADIVLLGIRHCYTTAPPTNRSMMSWRMA